MSKLHIFMQSSTAETKLSTTAGRDGHDKQVGIQHVQRVFFSFSSRDVRELGLSELKDLRTISVQIIESELDRARMKVSARKKLPHSLSLSLISQWKITLQHGESGVDSSTKPPAPPPESATTSCCWQEWAARGWWGGCDEQRRGGGEVFKCRCPTL